MTVTVSHGFGTVPKRKIVEMVTQVRDNRLAIRSGNRLYYWNGTALVQVACSGLGPVASLESGFP